MKRNVELRYGPQRPTTPTAVGGYPPLYPLVGGYPPSSGGQKIFGGSPPRSGVQKIIKKKKNASEASQKIFAVLDKKMIVLEREMYSNSEIYNMILKFRTAKRI